MESVSDNDAEHRAAAERAVLVQHLARMAAGERDALARVYELTSAKLNALLLRMLPNATVAEEVLQEVYLTVWRRGETFDQSRASPITWLVTIARNKAIDRLRADKVRGRDPEPIDEVDLPDPSPSIIERLEHTEQHVRLFACLKELDARQQEVIRAAFFEDLTYEALALRKGVPVGTMKSWIRRGLLRLRGCLDG